MSATDKREQPPSGSAGENRDRQPLRRLRRRLCRKPSGTNIWQRLFCLCNRFRRSGKTPTGTVAPSPQPEPSISCRNIHLRYICQCLGRKTSSDDDSEYDYDDDDDNSGDDNENVEATRSSESEMVTVIKSSTGIEKKKSKSVTATAAAATAISSEKFELQCLTPSRRDSNQPVPVPPVTVPRLSRFVPPPRLVANVTGGEMPRLRGPPPSPPTAAAAAAASKSKSATDEKQEPKVPWINLRGEPMPMPQSWLTTLHQHGYRLTKRLASNQTSIVFEAWKTVTQPETVTNQHHHQHHYHAVVKFMPHRDTIWFDYISVEVTVCRTVVHRFITKTYDVFRLRDVTMITHEYAADDMRGFITKMPPGEYHQLDRKLVWMAQMTDALGYLHGNGIAHCDIKPQNILMFLDTRHNSIVAKLYDFGFAAITPWRERYNRMRYEGRSPEEIRQTMKELRRAGFQLDCRRGTIICMAPEVLSVGYRGCEGTTQFDPFMADIWSMAVTFYFMVFERWPYGWTGRNSMKHYQEIWSTDWKKIWNACRQIGGEPLVELMIAMFRLNPKERPLIDEILRFRIFADSPMVNHILTGTPHEQPFLCLFE